jgi:hypothetical protein
VHVCVCVCVYIYYIYNRPGMYSMLMPCWVLPALQPALIPPCVLRSPVPLVPGFSWIPRVPSGSPGVSSGPPVCIPVSLVSLGSSSLAVWCHAALIALCCPPAVAPCTVVRSLVLVWGGAFGHCTPPPSWYCGARRSLRSTMALA